VGLAKDYSCEIGNYEFNHEKRKKDKALKMDFSTEDS
jgi:hypothetical protein